VFIVILPLPSRATSNQISRHSTLDAQASQEGFATDGR
jgi:hypothetical protein